MRPVHRRVGHALLGAAVLALGACTFPASPGSPAPPSAVPNSARPSTPVPVPLPTSSSPRVGLPSQPLPSTTASRSCDDRVLDARTVHLKGSQGSVQWDLAVPKFSGAPSAAAVNRRVRASAQDAIDRGLRAGKDDAGARRTVAGEGTVTTSDRRTVQVELRWADYLAGTAHPTDYVATTVVTTQEGRPVRLREVLNDVPSGLRAIGKAIKPMARPSDPSGLAPKEKNFAAWQTTPEGMRFSFQDYQLGGRGLRSYTVPWATMRPLLSAYGTGLLDPDIDQSTC